MAGVTSLFSGPKMPTPQPVVRMPDPGDPDALAARKRTLSGKSAQGGRASTDLSGGGDGTYINDVLGK